MTGGTIRRSVLDYRPVILLLVIMSMVVGGLEPLFAEEEALRPVSLALLWIPQAQFAGFFVAQELGIYREYGLDVRFIPGGAGISPSRYLLEGQADFAIMWLTTAVQMQAQGLDLVNLAQLVQRSGLMLVAHADSGITEPEDMHRKKVGVWGADYAIPPRAFFRKFNIQVQEIQQSNTINLFLRRAIDVASAMWYNEYHLFYSSGLDPDEIQTFFFSDYDLNFPEDGLYCLSSTIERDPDLVRDFVYASLDGWQEAFRDPEQALDVVMRYVDEAHTGTNRVHQRWMLARMEDMMMPEGDQDPLGFLKPTDYQFVTWRLLEDEMIETLPRYNQFYLPLARHRAENP